MDYQDKAKTAARLGITLAEYEAECRAYDAQTNRLQNAWRAHYEAEAEDQRHTDDDMSAAHRYA